MWVFFLIQFFFIYLFLAKPGLPCYKGFSLVVESRGYAQALLGGLLIVVASLAVQQGSRVHGVQQLQFSGSRAQAQ